MQRQHDRRRRQKREIYVVRPGLTGINILIYGCRNAWIALLTLAVSMLPTHTRYRNSTGMLVFLIKNDDVFVHVSKYTPSRR